MVLGCEPGQAGGKATPPRCALSLWLAAREEEEHASQIIQLCLHPRLSRRLSWEVRQTETAEVQTRAGSGDTGCTGNGVRQPACYGRDGIPLLELQLPWGRCQPSLGAGRAAQAMGPLA